jgi:hypothetical protein
VLPRGKRPFRPLTTAAPDLAEHVPIELGVLTTLASSVCSTAITRPSLSHRRTASRSTRSRRSLGISRQTLSGELHTR